MNLTIECLIVHRPEHDLTPIEKHYFECDLCFNSIHKLFFYLAEFYKVFQTKENAYIMILILTFLTSELDLKLLLFHSRSNFYDLQLLNKEEKSRENG